MDGTIGNAEVVCVQGKCISIHALGGMSACRADSALTSMTLTYECWILDPAVACDIASTRIAPRKTDQLQLRSIRNRKIIGKPGVAIALLQWLAVRERTNRLHGSDCGSSITASLARAEHKGGEASLRQDANS